MTDVQDRGHDDLAALYRAASQPPPPPRDPQLAVAFQCFGAGLEQRVGDAVAALDRASVDSIRPSGEQRRARAYLERLGRQ